MSENFDEFILQIGHPTRRRILSIIVETPGISYSKILKALNTTTGRLNFHLSRLKPLLEIRDQGYHLNPQGTDVYSLLSTLNQRYIDSATPTNHEQQASSLTRRILAYLIDFLLIIGVVFVSTAPEMFSLEPQSLALPIVSEVVLPAFMNQILQVLLGLPSPDNVNLLLRLYILAISWIYWTLLEGYQGQSLGKMVLGIKIIDINGGKITLHEAALRALAKALFLPLDLLVGILKTRKQGWIRYFDYYTRTIVIHT